MSVPVLRPRSIELAPLGLRTRVESAAPELLEAVVRAFGPAVEPAAPVGAALRLRLSPGGREGSAPVVLRVAGARLVLSGGGAAGGADAARGTAWCTLAPSLAAAPERVAAEVVEPLLLFLLTRAGRVPLHAAGVVVGGTAAVLAGPSGTGKSTIAHAAARAGHSVLSDDTVYLQLRPSLRVWGLARPIHLLADEIPAGAGPLRLRAGRWKRAVTAGGAAAPAERAALFLLERGAAAALQPITREEAEARVVAGAEPGFDHFREALPAAVRALAARGAWRLVLSRDPEEALALLREAVGGPRV